MNKLFCNECKEEIIENLEEIYLNSKELKEAHAFCIGVEKMTNNTHGSYTDHTYHICPDCLINLLKNRPKSIHFKGRMNDENIQS